MNAARSATKAAAFLAALGLAGCTGWQSALDPHGMQSNEVAWLVWLFTALSGVIWLAVVIVLALALTRRRAMRLDPLTADVDRERRIGSVIATCAALTLVIVIGLTILSYASQRDLFTHTQGALALRLIGHQWWWEVRDEDARSGHGFVSANEMHVPVGETITVALDSTDVIHSFWVPSLAGKMDLIPGRHNSLQFAASRAGVYRAQCAEFCGHQHAHMAMLVVASPREEFEAWRDAEIAPAASPATEEETRGRRTFESRGCATCHTIRGTPAAGKVGPDLTHVGGRRTIAAGTLPMSRGNLAAWIADPQGVKPGNAMPPTKLSPEELTSLSAYLAALE